MGKVKITIDEEEYRNLLKIKNNFDLLLNEKYNECYDKFKAKTEEFFFRFEHLKEIYYKHQALVKYLTHKPWLIRKIAGIDKKLKKLER